MPTLVQRRLVTRIGSRTDLPAERVEELDDCAIFVVATTEITDCETDREIAKTIRDAMAPIEAAFEQKTV